MAFHQEIVNSGMRIPVVFMTGHGDIEMEVKAMKAGALDFLANPFNDQDMLDAVALALAQDSERLAAEATLASLRASYQSPVIARERGDGLCAFRPAEQADCHRDEPERNHGQGSPWTGNVQDECALDARPCPQGRIAWYPAPSVPPRSSLSAVVR
jgi:DNA-binding response OmpR family regulator